MTITLFPPFSRKTSQDQMILSFKEGSTVKDLVECLVNRDNNLKIHLGTVFEEEDIRLHALIVCNDGISRLDRNLKDGDHLKFLHPLQGG